MNFRKIWLKRGALFALDLHEPHAPQPSSSAQNPFLRQGRLSQSPVTSPAGGFWLKRQLLPQPAPCREGWSQRWQSWGCIAPTPRLALLCCWAKFLLPQCNVRFALLVSVSAHWDHTPPPCPQGSTLLAQQKTCKVCPGFWRERLCPCYSRRSVHVAVQGAVTALSAMPSPPKLLCPEGQTWCQTLSWHSANCSCSAAHLGCCGTMLWERGCSSGPGLRATLDLSLHPLELCPGWSGGSEALWVLFIWMQPVS